MPEYTIRIKGRRDAVQTDGSRALLESLRAAGSSIHAPCGGNGTCKQCRVRVTGRCRGLDGTERDCAGEELLACRWYPAGDVELELSAAAGERVLTDAEDIAPGGTGLGLAVDIGTTTVAAYLYDLVSGTCLASRGAMNAQRAYGADVISRIRNAAEPGGLEALSRVIREQIRDLARALCPHTGRISCVSIAGNTVMEHLFSGLSPESIGVAPFAPLSLFGGEGPAADSLDGFSPDCRLYLCPAVAGYVGGDITAGLLSSGAYRSEGQVLFIDVGTNGEMALGNRDGFLCCATAAGPAFEGAEIAYGSPARDGAINAVARDMSYTVLGGGKPRSICGSGLIDAVAALLYQEIIDETGRMEGERYVFGNGVYLSGKDVRRLQLAKAAVRAGIETLLEKTGTGYDGIGEVLIAGGFGAYLRTESACAIGLLPPALLEKTRHVGNSAGRGAAMALTAEGRRELEHVRSLCRYEELSGSAVFNDRYIEAMMFDEWEDVHGD